MKGCAANGGPARRRRAFAWTVALSIVMATCGLRSGLAQSPLFTQSLLEVPDSEEPVFQKDILDLDLEQLAKVQVRVTTTGSLATQVTTVSRTSRPIARTPAAVYVVTNEMIRRSGARNIPEVLRTVPGVDVARINASTWAISIRGFNSRFANKLLVQIDGVAIYSPLHSGVFWEREPVMLDDVERIEVIRGPGGTIWGNNAVNGIINIVTKSAKDTQGIYADVGGGSEHREFSDLRVGAQSGDVAYRVWGANADDDCGYVPFPDKACDYYHYAQGGFRADWTPSREDMITFVGDFVDGTSTPQGFTDSPFEPINSTGFTKTVFVTRWSHAIDDETDWQAQCYYYNPYGKSNEILETNANVDVDFGYHMKRDRHDILCGCGYRNDQENLTFTQGPLMQVHTDSEQIPCYFAQDTIAVVEDRLFATFGSKFDNNSVTNFEYQPTAKLAWTPNDQTSVWAAITRAVRTPSLLERSNNSDLQSEDLLSYELGYRRQVNDQLFWELAVFFNRYNNLIGTNNRTQMMENIGDADTYGFEYDATYQVNPTWRLTGSYSFFIECVEYPQDYSGDTTSGATPRNQFYLQSGWDLGHDVTFDVMFRYVDSLVVGVQKYFVGDIRLAWRPRKRLELSIVGQNLFDGRHYEFVDSGGAKATEVEPGVYGMVSWRY
jgi:iron complex outermembrane recepter protein